MFFFKSSKNSGSNLFCIINQGFSFLEINLSITFEKDSPSPFTFLSKDLSPDYPIVAKTNMGARAFSVQIFRKKSKAIGYAKKAFKKGVLHGDAEAKDADWKFVIFQEYIESEIEWRMVCIGDKFFGHQN